MMHIKTTQHNHIMKLCTAQSFRLPRGHKFVLVAHVSFLAGPRIESGPESLVKVVACCAFINYVKKSKIAIIFARSDAVIYYYKIYFPNI